MDRATVRRALLGLALSGTIGVLAQKRRLLTTSGALGAVVTGTCAVAGGGWDWGIALVYFFVSSSTASVLAPRRKVQVAADKFAKGSQRDLAQSLANGGVASVAAFLHAMPWGQRHQAIAAGAYLGALATATADTWATELGTLSRQPPRLLTSGRLVAPGTSGGVTALGLAASAAGAFTLGTVFAASRALVSRSTQASVLAEVGAATVAGVTGSLVDSVLGATLQAMYLCQRCQVETERRQHVCGTLTKPVRGLAWLSNDGVNFAATFAGAVIGTLLYQNQILGS
jgi:uncharacterized protein (TIGR00297 family)